MLRIHKSTSKKLPIAIGASICGAGALLGFMTLIFTPELLHAEVINAAPGDARTLMDIVYMQDMTATACKNSREHETKRLVDKRDNKAYWVAKLKDGNCWMVQNLAYDVPGLESSGLENWGTQWDSDQNTIKFNNDYQNYVYTQQTSLHINCYYPDNIYLCLEDVSGKIASEEPDFYLENNAAIKDNYFDSHYLIGNYYTWLAATKGSNADNEVTTAGICPTNWKLPYSGESYNSVSGSFYFLLKQYGMQDYYQSTYIPHFVLSSGVDPRITPLYYLYSGTIINNNLGAMGTYGYIWSGEAYDETQSNILIIGSGDGGGNKEIIRTNPNNKIGRNRGLSVRCLYNNEIDGSNVDINIDPIISLDVADEVNVEKTETNPSAADLDVKVSSNQKYSVGISAKDPNLTSTISNVKIPARSGLLNTAENGWGIKLKDDAEFTALTSNLQTFYTASGAEIKIIPFTIGVSTAPDLPNGTYATDIVITATQN